MKQVFDSFTANWVSGDGRPVIVLVFTDSDAGREAFAATRAPEARRALDGTGKATVRWNAKARTLSLICPGEFVIERAYSARVRKWTTDGLDWFQQFLDEYLPSYITDGAASAIAPAGTGLSEKPVAVDPSTMRIPLVATAEREGKPAGGYRAIVEELEGLIGHSPAHKQVASNRRQRSIRARAAVILRSGGRCENPGCASPAFREVTGSGEAILEVDHVRDLALGGEDHPLNMVALCPNCHAVKTRGRSAEALREVLAQVSRERHSAAWLGQR
ncbi:HNH endonuclease [Streptomyces umbrinus]|uniref:HNH endonuclease n=1 Tax=Streptomyces umbrinus TaxID=67370 RepID=UPI0033FD0DAC